MSEQICFDSMISDEQKAFELVYPRIKDVIYDAPIDSGILVFQEIGNCSSVYFMNSMKFSSAYESGKKARYIIIPEDYKHLLPADAPLSNTKSDSGMVRIEIDSYEDITKYVDTLRMILDSICRKYRDFGCCGRYLECSDAKACIHPDPKFALACWYRYNLLDGKIFYGKNKNT